MKLVLATSNPGKLEEIRTLLKSPGCEVFSQSEYNVDDAVENGKSFTENALIKARHASVQTGLPAIADDSGLEVDYLEGRPGIYSARYAGEGAADAENIEKLLNELEGVPFESRTARFHCVIVLVKTIDDPDPLICHGLWEGVIAESPSGDNGFGYDPVFFVPELGCTSAELSPAIKNRHSHRGQALQKLLQQLL
jgi:XTP/dITP diphosphohydrolase